MADYSISLSIDYDKSELKNVEQKIDNLTDRTHYVDLRLDKSITKQLERLESYFNNTEDAIANVKKTLGTLGDEKGINNILVSVNKMSNSLNEISSQFKKLDVLLDSFSKKDFNALSNIGNNVAKQAQQAGKIMSEAAEKATEKISSKGNIGKYFEINKDDSNAFEAEMDKLVKQWTNGKGKKIGKTNITTKSFYDKEKEKNVEKLVKAQVTYNNELGETVKKTIAWRQIGSEKKAVQIGNYVKEDAIPTEIMGWAEVSAQYSKSLDNASTATSRFVKQQKKEASNLTNTINQLHRSAIDQNASRPIKENGHLDSLASKYDEVTIAIQRMQAASDENTFIEEQNNVKALISEYKSLKSEYKNAENVSSKLKGTDFDSALKIAESDLKKLKAEAREFPQALNGLDDAFNNITDKSSLDDFTNQLKVAKAELSNLKAEASASQRSEKVGIGKSVLENSINDLKRVSPEIDKFKTKINGAEVTLSSLSNELSQVKTEGDLSVVTAKFNAFTGAAKSAGLEVSKTASNVSLLNKIISKIEFGKDNNSKFDIEVGDAEYKFNRLAEQSDELRVKIDLLKDSLSEMKTAYKANDYEALISANERYEKALKDVNNQLEIRTKAEKNKASSNKLDDDIIVFQTKIDAWLKKNSAAAKDFGSDMLALRDAAEGCDRVTLNHLKSEFQRIDKSAEAAGKKTLSFVDNLKNQVTKYASYLSVAEVFMYAEQALRSMFEQVKLIDSAMTELKKVTNETDASYSKFLTNAASRAREIGTTIDGLVSSTAAFARLGYGFEDAQGLAEVANIYAVVGDEIDGVEGATESLISTMAAFKDEMNGMSDSDFAMSIVDKFNEIGNNFAISSGGIGEALERSASSLNAANNTIDESIALITAANTVVQDPEAVGTAFKTISMRIRGAKTELEDAGLETEGMVESTAKLREEILALTGVDIMKNNKEFKSTYAILDELSVKWQDLSDIQQATVTELIAGKRQGNIISSLMTNFETARNALEVSLNSSGSAMQEHEKWQQSLEAQILKLQASWQSLSQSFLSSDFLKVVLDGVIALVDGITKLIDTIGVIPTLIGAFAIGKTIWTGLNVGGLNSIVDILQVLSITFPKAADAVGIFTKAISGTSGLTAVAAGAKGAISGLWTVMAAHPILATVAIVGAAVTAYNHFTESAEELADRIKEVTTKYKEQHKELEKIKDDYDTSNADSMISRYGELSKGVTDLGENISLTSDEYSEYQNIVDTIANQIPSLVTGYNSQGDAILECAGNVDKLSEAYKNLIKEQNNEVLKNGADIIKDFQNDLKNTSMYENNSENPDSYNTDHINNLKEIMNLSGNELVSYVNSLDIMEVERISELLREYGIERDTLFNDVLDNGFATESWNDHIIRAVNDKKKEVKNILSEASKDLNVYAEELGTVTEAYFSTAFLGGDGEVEDYSHLSERMQNVINQVASSFDSEFYAQFLDDENPYESLTAYLDSMLVAFDSLSSVDAEQFEASFNLKTQFNSGDISYGEYVKGLQNVGSLIDNISGLDEEAKSQIKLALNTEEVIKDYDALTKRLVSDVYAKDLANNGHFSGINVAIEDATEKAREFLDGLTASEYAVAVDLMVNDEIDFSDFNIDSLREYIEKQAKLNEALNFNANIEIDKTSLEALNTALEESASAMGLTTESIDSLKSKYAELDGYDSATLFEKTANGVKLNREEVAKLEKEYNDLTKTEVQEHIDTLTQAYNDNVVAIDECTNAAERAQLIADNERYKDQIEELAEYQTQLEGVTGAYQRWLDAQNTPEDYEGYELVATSREDIKDEIDRGFLSNASKEYIDLLSGENLQGGTIDDYANAWDKLDDKITGAGHSINDFFTVNDDGDITATGIDRFFNSIQTDFKGSVAKFNEETGKWEYNFSRENLQKIQDEWGLGIEAIELLLEAAGAAGYDVDWDGLLDNIDLDTAEFETLVSYAESAQSELNKLKGYEDLKFNFTTTNVTDATTEFEKARKAYVDLITNDDGTVNIEAEGAEEMRVILSTLLVQKQQLSTPAIMKVDTSQIDQAETDIIDVINKAQALQKAYENYEIAISTGVDVEGAKKDLSTAIDGMKGTSVDVRADLKLPTDDELQTAKDSIGDIKVGASLDDTAIGNIESTIQTQCTPEVIAKVTGLDESAIEDGSQKVVYTADHKDVDDFINSLSDISKKIIYTYETEGTKPNPNNIRRTITYEYKTEGDVPEAYGTAHSKGTANSCRAFVRGNWGIKGNGVALGGEMGRELIVRDGKFFTIGDTSAEFFRYKPNDIIFNAAQTESLFKYGGIKGAKPRGTMLAGGTAFSNGKAFAWDASATESNFANKRKNTKKKTETKTETSTKDNSVTTTTTTSWGASATESNFSKNRNTKTPNSTSTSTSSSTKKEEKEFKETIDWIEVAIDRIERAIDQLDTKANSVYRTWSERNNSLTGEISKVKDEIDLQKKAYDRYIVEASKVGLSSSWAEKVRNGKVDISTITDEDLADKISQYQDWFEKALACKDAILELTETESELYAQRFDNISTRYEGMLGVIEHEKNMLEEDINQAEAQGYLVSSKYYNALIKNESSNIVKLEKQKAEMLAELNTAIKGTEEWYRRVSEIDAVTEAIEQGKTSILEYKQTIQQLSWETFDLLQDKISSVTEEADFLIELLSSEKLFDDKGRTTDEGKATFGLHGQNYNTYMYQADLVAKEAERLKKQLESDPYDTKLEERYREMISLQQEYITNAQQEKEAIRDLVAEGIEIELDALQELIDKKNEQLQSERDLYEYQKKVKEQTKEISSLEKQLAAFSGDDSEEAQQKIQQIKVDLESAREELQETEYDKYISDSEALLDDLYLEYETLLNERLDNLDALLAEVITEINNDALIISDTLSIKAEEVGYSLSDSMKTIWDENTVKTNDVLTIYGDKFLTEQTNTNNALKAIKTSISNMISQLGKEADDDIEENKTSSSAKPKASTSTNNTKPTTTNTANNGNKSSGDGTPKKGDKVKFVSGQYYYDSEGKNPSGSKYQGKEVYITNVNNRSWATHPYHISTGNKLGSGDLGWVKKNQISGYATGKRNFVNDEIAWTQEDGREFIIRPSDGAILTPVAKGDSVLNASASSNIWDMANSPTDFIRNNLGLDNANVPSGSNVNNTVTQNFENVVFSMPNVHSYNELIAQMQKDKNFEKLILSMSVDRLAGKSSLAKNKAIR